MSSSGIALLIVSNSCSCRSIPFLLPTLLSVNADSIKKDYLTHDLTRAIQVLPIEIDSLAKFIPDDAVKAEISLPNLVQIWTMKFSCYE